MKHTISVLVENHFGAFDRIATYVQREGISILEVSLLVKQKYRIFPA